MPYSSVQVPGLSGGGLTKGDGVSSSTLKDLFRRSFSRIGAPTHEPALPRPTPPRPSPTHPAHSHLLLLLAQSSPPGPVPEGPHRQESIPLPQTSGPEAASHCLIMEMIKCQPGGREGASPLATTIEAPGSCLRRSYPALPLLSLPTF